MTTVTKYDVTNDFINTVKLTNVVTYLLIDVNDGSYLIFSEHVVKVCADSCAYNEKTSALQFKTGDFVKFCKKNKYFHHKAYFSSFRQFFVKNKILWS